MINKTNNNSIFEELLKQSGKLIIPEKGSMVTGTVISVTKSTVLVDVGWKSEGIVAGKELKSEMIKHEELKPGEKIMVYVVNPEDEEGELVLSLRRTDQAKRWLELEKAHKTGDPIEVTVVESNTGGLICEIDGGIRGFLPISQIDARRIYIDGKKLIGRDVSERVQEGLSKVVGERIKIGVSEVVMTKKRVILSENRLLQGSNFRTKEETLRKMKFGDKMHGIVTGITPFGIFVNAEGVDGLVHLSELSWDKVENTGDLYNIGQEVDVQVIDISDSGRRVAYSIKRLLEDPWHKAIAKYKVGDIVDGVVQKVVNYGFFVRIGEGLNGLVHISEVSFDLVKDINEFVKVDDKVKVKILSISSTERHLRLSLKRVNEKPETSKIKKEKTKSEDDKEKQTE